MNDNKQKVNYQLITDSVITSLVGRPRLLLHSCCGPCSSYVLEYLTQYFDVTVFYYNPNIRPEDEYQRRLETQSELIDRAFPNVKLVVPQYDVKEFESLTAGMEGLPEGGDRCTVCFQLRIGATAKYAKENGYEWFCTTLSVSPHKDAERLNRIGEEMAEEYKLKWLPSDFKKREGYKRSIELSEEYGLYRQDYCGCKPREPFKTGVITLHTLEKERTKSHK